MGIIRFSGSGLVSCRLSTVGLHLTLPGILFAPNGTSMLTMGALTSASSIGNLGGYAMLNQQKKAMFHSSVVGKHHALKRTP